MNLDLVLGMSCKNISCLACDQNSSLAAHTASGVLVLLDTATNCQVRYLHLRQNALSSVSFSPDGALIVTGEIGYRPAVRVWRVKDGCEIASLYGHEFGIKSVLFCSNMKQIISVGLEHDNVVNLWSWPDKFRMATNKIVDVIKAVAYSDSGCFLVTAGIRHIKFWYPQMMREQGLGVLPPVQCLYGRPGILGDCKQQTFVDVACGNGGSSNYVYAITRNGGLVILSATDRILHSHKIIEEFKGNCLKVQDQILFIGFSSGDVHMFNAITLLHLASLPAPTFFRRTCVNGGGVFTLVFNPSTTLLITAYKNSSMCVWDLKDAGNVKQKYVAVYHSKAITNSDIFMTRDSRGHVRETLVTVSHDSTVRLWGVVIGDSICYDRLSILYTDDTPLQPTVEPLNKTLDNAGIITAVKVSPDRKYIVTGNRAGNICVYDRLTFEHSLTVLAHNREVTCLAIHTDSSGRTILASGSRDRLIHVMDVNNDFRLITTFNIHSSSITVVSFCEMFGSISMISCSSDRSLSVCTAPVICDTGNKRMPVFQLSKCTTIMSTPMDICIDPNSKQISVGCQDGYIRVLDMALLQERRMFRGCTCEERQIHKLCLDSKGSLLLSAASDKTINVICFPTGNILITLAGHTKFVTGLIFTSSGDHVISTSMDGCVFIWHISEKTLKKRLSIRNRKILTQSEDCIVDMSKRLSQKDMSDKTSESSKQKLKLNYEELSFKNDMEKSLSEKKGGKYMGNEMVNKHSSRDRSNRYSFKNLVTGRENGSYRSCCQLCDNHNIQANNRASKSTLSEINITKDDMFASRNSLRPSGFSGKLISKKNLSSTLQGLISPMYNSRIAGDVFNCGTSMNQAIIMQGSNDCDQRINQSGYSPNACFNKMKSNSVLGSPPQGMHQSKNEICNDEELANMLYALSKGKTKTNNYNTPCPNKDKLKNYKTTKDNDTSWENAKQKSNRILPTGW